MEQLTCIEGPRPGRALGVGPQLAAAEYVEEELVVQGMADLYTYDAQWNTRAAPRGRAVHHAAARAPPARREPRTGRCGDRAAACGRRHGVGVAAHRPDDRARGPDRGSASRRTCSGCGRSRRATSSATRELEIPEPGLGFDIVARIAAWLRGPSSPLPSMNRLLMTGRLVHGHLPARLHRRRLPRARAQARRRAGGRRLSDPDLVGRVHGSAATRRSARGRSRRPPATAGARSRRSTCR